MFSGKLTEVNSLNGTLSQTSTLNGTLSNPVLRGYSAYQVAVENGFEGTEQEWLESLKGEVDLSEYAKKTDIPTDYAKEKHTHKEYLTEHQSLEDYAKKTDIPTDYAQKEHTHEEYVTRDELDNIGGVTSWNDLEDRPFYETTPEFDIQWDGVIGDRFALDMSALGFDGIKLVKISDNALSVEQLIGSEYLYDESTTPQSINEFDLDTTTYSGGVTVNNGEMVSIYDATQANAALGLPDGYLTNGLYFFYTDEGHYVCRLVAPTKIKKLDPKFLPEGIGYEIPPKFDITWDGNMDGHVALDMSALGYSDTYFVKVSDDVFTTDEVIGGTLSHSDGYYTSINEYDIDTTTYAGAFTLNNYIVIVHDADALANALGIPTGIYPNGVYFWLTTDNYCHTKRFVGATKIVKIDEKFLPDMNVDINSLGLHSVATSGNYNDLRNRPTVYTDVVRYNVQSLSSTAKSRVRNNIDVYGKEEIDASFSKCAKSKDVFNLTYNTQEITLPDIDAEKNIVCYGNGKFVLFSSIRIDGRKQGKQYYSEDGVTWTENHNHTDDIVRCVCYGNGKFVAVHHLSASYSMMHYSEDGVNWSDGVEIKGSYNSICYGNDKFVAVNREGFNSSSAYSDDGVTWTEKDNARIPYTVGLAYGNGKFVTIDRGGSCHSHISEDGLTWELASDIVNVPGALYTDICYGNGKFVAVSNGKNYSPDGIVTHTVEERIIYSEDGITWGTAGIFDGGFYSLCYGNDKFVAVGKGKAAYSEDGINWKSVVLSDETWLDVCYGNDKFVAVSEGKAAYSEDGINWVERYNTTPKALMQSNIDVTLDIIDVIKLHINTLTSPNGTKYQLTVDDNGNLSTTIVIE